MTRLLKDGKVIPDDWTHVGDDDALPDDGPVIVSLTRWQEEKDSLTGRNSGLGIRLAAGESPADLGDDLARFQVVALEFPKFADGRAYSYARLLKDRLAFDGEVRAVGDVLRDQYRAMYRCGFDTLEIDRNVSDAELEAAWTEALGDFRHAYQAAERGPQTILRRRHAAPA